MKNMKAITLAVVICAALSLLSSAVPASAKSSAILTVEASSQIVSSQWLAAGDENGHVIGLQQREGTGTFSNGETARYSTVSTFDSYRSKNGTSKGYSTFTFSDGSTIILSWTADIIRKPDGLSTNHGKGVIIKGSGRFKGIEGGSTFSGRQLKSVADDPKQTASQSATINYTLP